IKVKVKNYGKNVIDSVQVQWELGGVAQTPFNLTLPLDTIGGTGINEREVALGSYNFGIAPVNLKVWTDMPNGVIDTTNYNDTFTTTLQLQTSPALSGTYTVNSAVPTGGNNYQNFTALINDLHTYGVCG